MPSFVSSSRSNVRGSIGPAPARWYFMSISAADRYSTVRKPSLKCTARLIRASSSGGIGLPVW